MHTGATTCAEYTAGAARYENPCRRFPLTGAKAVAWNKSCPTNSRRISSTRYAPMRGRLGTRETIERVGMHDYADLVIALAQNELDFPKPAADPGA